MRTSIGRALAACRGERGIALPLAMIMLVTIAALMVAFAVLAQTEPLIASNQDTTARARSLADSGVERAVWALTNPAASGIGPLTADQPSSTGYDGGTQYTVGTDGAFSVDIDAGPHAPLDAAVTSLGSSAGAHQKVQVILLAPPPPLNPPCALCVAGSTQVTGNSNINASSGGCNGGTPPADAVMASQTATISGSATVTGYGTSGTTAYTSGVSSSQFLYNPLTLAELKAIAQANHTYFTGAVTTANMPTTGGVIYIDTLDGTPYTGSTPDSNAGSLNLNDNRTYKGIIIVAGTATLSGSLTIDGLLYVQNDVTVSGTVTINGAIASENQKDVSSTNIDSLTAGNVHVNYNCDYVGNGGGTVSLPKTWRVKPGSYTYQSGT